MSTTSVRSLQAERIGTGLWPLILVAPLAALSAATTLFWPTFALVLAALAVVLALALRAPAYAFVLVLLLFGLEGSIKIRFWLEGTPLSSHGNTVGALLLDIAFLLVVLASLRAESRHRLLGVWRATDRWGQAGLVLLAAWLVLSVLQIHESGSLKTGVEGFRLTQLYVLALLPGAALLSDRVRPDRLLQALLGVLTVIALYGAVRTVAGPASSERSFALSHPVASVAADNVFRNVGSFSGTTGLVSYLIPAAVFAFMLGLLAPRLRIAGWILFGLCVVGLVGTYIRAALLAAALGAVISLALVYRRQPRRIRDHKVTAVVAVLLLLVAVAGASYAFDRTSNLSRRAHNIVHPLRDRSVKIRLHTYKSALHVVEHHPLGTGVGSVHQSARTMPSTHNSFLTVAREQGVPGGLLFALGIVLVLLSVGRGVRRRSGFARTLGAAAWGALLATMLFWLTWDNVQQPGKVLIWGLMGFALAVVWTSNPALEGAARMPLADTIRSGWTGLRGLASGRRIAVLGALVAALIVLAVGVSLPRKADFQAARIVTVTPRLHFTARGAARYVNSLLATVRSAVSRGFGTRTYNPAVPDSTILSRVTAVPGAAARTVAVVASLDRPALAQRVTNQITPDLAAQTKLDLSPPYKLTVGPPAGPPAVPDHVDRLADRLPGGFPPRPAIAWAAGAAALVGLVLLLALSVAARPSRGPA